MTQEPDQDRDDDQPQAEAAALHRPEHGLAERDLEARRQDIAADSRDEEADASDHDAHVRDQAAEQRDDSADKSDKAKQTWLSKVVAAPVRKRARADRESAAEDRNVSAEDRERSRDNRHASGDERERASQDRGAAWEAMIHMRELLSAAESDATGMRTISKAQNLLMRTTHAGPNTALADLCLRAARQQSSLVAASNDVLANGADAAFPADA